jgi:hypothetical protein
MISIYSRMCPPSLPVTGVKKVTAPPGFQPNLHRIDQISIKWMPDRKFCIEKLIRNLSHRMEEKNSNWISYNIILWPDRPVWDIFPPDIFPDQSARMTDIGFYQTESMPLAYKNPCVRGCTYKLKEFLRTFFKQIPTF